jgi:hypothetical protein
MSEQFPYIRGETEVLNPEIPHVQSIKERPGKILRRFAAAPYRNEEELTREIVKIRGLYNTLEKKYKVRVVKRDFLVEGRKNSKNILLYSGKIVTDRVFGENLKDLKELAPELVAEIRNLILNLLKYFKEKLEKRSEFLDDIYDPEQYMYGSVKGQEEKHIYLVDIGDTTNKPGEDSIQRYKEFLIYDLEKLLEFCGFVSKLSPETKMEDIEEQIKELIDFIEYKYYGQKFST